LAHFLRCSHLEESADKDGRVWIAAFYRLEGRLMKSFLSSHGHSRASVVSCVPVVEELECRRLLAATGAGTLLPPPTPTSGPGQSPLATFFPPTAFFSPLGGATVGPQAGLSAASTTGVLPLPTGAALTPAAINALTPQQALAQRALITAPPPPPPPVNAYGEGMITYVTPLELSAPGPNPSAAVTGIPVAANVETGQPGGEYSTAQPTTSDWQDAVDTYFAEAADR
jgi:hypothetical protein